MVSYSPDVPPVVETRPLLVLLEEGSAGGVVLCGGPIIGYEGAAFWGGSGMNKWPLPPLGDRTVTLNPVNVTGKTNVQITIAVAGTYLDFEQSTGARGSSDYLEMAIDPDGDGPQDFQRLMFFTAPSGTLKYFDDSSTHPENPVRLRPAFQDVTYDVPPGATDMVIEIRGLSTFWNEIMAFDDIRVTSGTTLVENLTLNIQRTAGNIVINFTGGTLQRNSTLAPATWQDVSTTGASLTLTPAQQTGNAFYRVKH
jgi:hypothetical protein